jgi:copper(I)-binding protein
MTLCFSILRTSFAGAAVLGMLATSTAAFAQDHSGHPAENPTQSPAMTMSPSMAMKPAAASGPQFKVGDLVVTAPWSRATPKGAKIGAGYLTIQNNGTAPDKLLSVETEVAGKADVHEMSMKDGVMHMRPLTGGVTIAPGKSIQLGPSGFHLMLMDLKKPLEQGQSFDATLRFEKAGPLQVKFQVGGIGAASAPKN